MANNSMKHFSCFKNPLFCLQRCFGAFVVLLWLSLLGPANSINSQDKTSLTPSRFDHVALSKIDNVVLKELNSKKFPGCVVIVGSALEISYSKSFGHRSVLPEQSKMEIDTVFDLASLTKPVVTSAMAMKLVEEEKIQLDAPIAEVWPEFAAHGKSEITPRHLLTHTSGLIADNSMKDYVGTRQQSLNRIANLKLVARPGEGFIYSDVGFIVLDEYITRVTGKSLDALFAEKLAVPLGLKDTVFNPSATIQKRCAPTEQRDGDWIQGEVHDPRSFALGGVAGHAGLFSTGNDLARYCQMLLCGGRVGNDRIFNVGTILEMVRPMELPLRNGRRRGIRALGWDVDSPYSSNRGDLFSSRAFGHGGFTGTGVWIDPEKDLFVVFLSNRLHPDGKGSVNRLIGRICTIAASARRNEVRNDSLIRTTESDIRCGVDELIVNGMKPLKGRRVGLISNHTGVTRDGQRTLDALANSPDVDLVAVFSPEHGLKGLRDDNRILDGVDSRTGVQVYSLYGATKKPESKQLESIDTLVFDIQDIGTRFYTYASTMTLAMDAAAENGKRFVVLDRPNPINGVTIEGPMLDLDKKSFTGRMAIPVRHGMTMGELAKMYAAEAGLDLDLAIIPVENWKRSMWFDQTGILWRNPSPNMRSLKQAALYPGIGLLETTNLSVGRGTEFPFEVVGAPWIGGLPDAEKMADRLNQKGFSGVKFHAIEFTPETSKYAGKKCYGIFMRMLDRRDLQAVDVGLHIALDLRTNFAKNWETKSLNRLLANDQVFHALLNNQALERIKKDIHFASEGFLRLRKKYLIYK